MSLIPPEALIINILFRRDIERSWGIFVISASLYAVCTLTWALDISVLWLEMYRFLPSRLSLPGSVPVSDALAGLNGVIETVRDACEVVIVSLCALISYVKLSNHITGPS